METMGKGQEDGDVDDPLSGKRFEIVTFEPSLSVSNDFPS